MKKCCLLIVSIFTIQALYGQVSKKDSLLHELSVTSRSDTTRVLVLLQLSEIAVESGEEKDFLAQALNESKRMQYEHGVAESCYSLGWLSFRNDEYDASLAYFSQALDVFSSLSDQLGSAKTLSRIATVREELGSYEEALEYYFQELEILEEIDAKYSIANCYNNIGNLFRIQDDFDKAMFYFKSALAIQNSLENELSAAGVLNSIALVHGELKQYDSAIHLYYQVLHVADENSSKNLAAIASNNLGKDYRNIAAYDSALKYLKRADELNVADGSASGHALAQTNLAETYLLKKDYGEALKYANESYRLAKELGNKRLISRSSNLLYQIHEAGGDYKKAFEYLKSYKIYEDSLFDSQKYESIAKLELAYNVEKKEQQIAALQRENELAALRRNILIGSVIVTGLIGFLLYNQQRLRSRKNRLLLEKEKEVDRMKSRFFANISHEFRTPLTLLIGPIDQIKQSVSDERLQLFLDIMKRNAGRLLAQVNQLLDLSKLDSGQLKLKVVEFDCVPFLKGIVMSFDSLARTRKINFGFSSEVDQLMLCADKDSLEKIIVNLVTNALKFTRAGDTVSVAVLKVEGSQLLPSGSEALEIVVKDTGIGFDAQTAEHIFERYYHTESDMQASTGIGLALVKELVESHSGAIEAKGVKGEGSLFRVHLPLGKSHWERLTIYPNTADYTAEVMADDVPLNDAEAGTDTGAEKTLLLIEDNEDVRLFIRKILEDQFKVLEAPDGKSGIRQAQEQVPDLIVTDIMMPGMDGYEVTRQLKTHMETSHIPVIMLTAKADLESKLQGLETEADDYLTKPFEATELLARVDNLIQSRAKLREQFSQIVTLKPKGVAITSIDAAFLDKLMVSIEDHLDDANLSVEYLGGLIGMSRSQLYRKLQAITGLSPNQLIRDIRLARSMELLKNNSGTAAEIAYMVGFSSPNYFSKCFHDKYGFAPGEVRKQYDPHSSGL
ncbi:MAG: tetratricopeptide repeat protein [Imperialibacter sp.]|uniref:hybrid sensor histidine kinase/response regulator transcription factor n=1 Tax=Imperialibacter sp. TaxID=2038411 RepID=UPI003A87B38A